MNFNWLITGLIEWHTVGQGGLVETLLREKNSFMTRFGQPVPAAGIFVILLYLSSALRYICYFVSLCYFYSSDRSLLNFVRASIVCFLAYFTFGSGVHENHACVPAVLGICWLGMDRIRYLEATLLAATFNANLFIIEGLDGRGSPFSRIVGWDVTLYLAAFNVILFTVLWLPLANWCRIEAWRNTKPAGRDAGSRVVQLMPALAPSLVMSDRKSPTSTEAIQCRHRATF